jgi:chromosome segregation ATPase
MMKRKISKERPPVLQLLLGLILLCLAVYSFALKNSRLNHQIWAQENHTPKSGRPSSPPEENESAWERIRELQAALNERESEIEKKKFLLEQKEQQLILIRGELSDQINTLQSLKREINEKKQEINEKLQELDEKEERRIKEIISLFERTPLDQTCSIITTLAETDMSTVIEIIMRMNKRKAKRLWESINPELAAHITRHIMEKDILLDKIRN